jgi:2-polyprenyl-3-methyl-5-hydroxy-6-metoxy-1,4-benzoquinol methylase
MKVSECALCRNVNFSPYLLVDKRQLVKCRNCGFIFSVEIPSPDEMDVHYSHSMEAGYLGKYRELEIKRGDLILRYTGNRGKNVLDVGCGLGFFLGLAREKGYTPYGIEPSIEASKYARCESGVEVFTGSITEFAATGKMFDIVTVQHVLEHIPRPVEFIRNIRRVLANGGMLVIVVPNANSLIGNLAREKWLGFAVDEHVCHYTLKTLRLLLERCGFGIRKFIVPQWDIGELLWAFHVYISNDNKTATIQCPIDGKTIQRSAVKAVLIKFLRPLAWIISLFRAGQEIIVFSETSSD